MKRLLVLILLQTIYMCFAIAQSHLNVVLRFNPSDFWLNENRTNIQTESHTFVYLSDIQKPAIPYLPIQVLIPGSQEYDGFTYTKTKDFFADNVILTPNPIEKPTNSDSITHQKEISYVDVQYPEENIIYTGKNCYGNYSVLNFLVAPWIYNTSQKKLEILTSVDLKIELQAVRNGDILSKLDSPLLPYLNVVNKDMGILVKEEASPKELLNRDNLYEYIIVTRDSLKNSFLPLMQWKKQKGIRSKILAIEEIDTLYSGATIQMKIKNCLYDYFVSHGLKYVLLGGDDTIVPVQRCYSIVNRDNNYKREDNTIPSDLFYSCFSGRFDWNANGNDTIAEIGDSVDFAQFIYVSRLPVRSTLHVTNATKKILDYEKCPTKHGWNNNILMSGNELFYTYSYNPRVSDAQYKSEKLYRMAIEPFWQGDRVRFYDTYTDLGNSSYQLDAINLQTELEKGYTFMEMATHGKQDGWEMEVTPDYYYSSASQLTNSKPTIITTMACLTNAFDNSTNGGSFDPCLSEAFIRNPYSGVVAYLGCSRQAWESSYPDGLFGTSFSYEYSFYLTLFSNDVKEKNWGKIVATAKSRKIPASNYEGADRWIQLGLNPIGDPEMPVFIETPKLISQCSVLQSDSCAIINIGADSCKVCVMSIDDDGLSVYEVYENSNNICIPPSTHTLQVCITKQNYIPKLFLFDPSTIFVQNEVIGGNSQYKANRICVGTAVTDYKEYGDVTILNGNTTFNANEVVLDPGTTIEKGAVLNIINEQ